MTGLDISPSAVAAPSQLTDGAGVVVTYRLGDCLKRPASLRGRFNRVFEHTCFCAIDPKEWDRYVRAIATALKPGGHLLGVVYNIQPKTGPPLGTTREELIERFGSRFRLRLEKLPRSFPNRKGKELLMLWEKKS